MVIGEGGSVAQQLLLPLWEMAKFAVAGSRFGKLTVIGEASRRYHLLVRCDCGEQKTVYRYNLTSGHTTSCGCNQVQLRPKHGMCGHPIHHVWRNMRYRCAKPDHPEYKNYGARGIRVCDRWRTSFGAFLEDMGANWQPGLSIERIDNDGNYEPGNCRWATAAEQARNQRGNVVVDTPWWGRMCLMDAAKRSGVPYPTLRHRYRGGRPLFP